MANGQLTEGPAPSPAAAAGGNGSGDGNDDLWQGYDRRYTNTGLEISVPTGRSDQAALLIAGAVFVAISLFMFATISSADMHNGAWIAVILIGLLGAMFAGVYVESTNPRALRTPRIEQIEIRPDGITINRTRYFARHDINSLWVDHESGAPRNTVMALIGTRQMTFLSGFDDNTAFVLSRDIEAARRQLWQDLR